MRPLTRILLTYAAVSGFALTQAGCTGAPTRGPMADGQVSAGSRARALPGDVALVPVRYEPKFESPPITAYTSETLKNAGIGVLGGAAVGAIAGCALGFAFGPLGIALCPYLAGMGAAGGAAGGGVVGAAAGAAEGAPKQETQAARAAVGPTMASLRLQQPLAEAVREATATATGHAPPLFAQMGPTSPQQRAAYNSLAPQGLQTVLETRVMRFGFDSVGGKDPDVALFIIARARLIDARSGKELWGREFAYLSRYTDLPTWAAQDSRLVKMEYERAHRALGERIAEEVFLVTAMGQLNARVLEPGQDYGACGLRAVSPRVQALSSTASPELAVVTGGSVDSLLPTLQWEPFIAPGATADQPPAATARYDLKIWRATPESTVGELVYQQNGIVGTSHTLMQPLQPGNTYLWSVRARSATPQAIYATRWSESRLPLYARRTELLVSVYASQPSLQREMRAAGFDVHSAVWSACALDFIPDRNYYRFTTPGQPETKDRQPPIPRIPPTVSQLETPHSRERLPQAPGPSARAATHAEAGEVAVTEAGLPKAGDRWVYQLTDRRRTIGNVTVEVVGADGRNVKERITREGYATFKAEREVQLAFSPPTFTPLITLPAGYGLTEFAAYFPPGTQLYVGQSWDHVAGRLTIPLTGVQTLVFRAGVVGQERVSVPAGQFETWRLNRSPSCSFPDKGFRQGVHTGPRRRCCVRSR
jgi:hypothetical protein